MGEGTILKYNFEKEDRSTASNLSNYINSRGTISHVTKGSIIARIFFATNVSEPNTSDDIHALDYLIEKLIKHVKYDRYFVDLDLIGSADYRGEYGSNWNLGKSRALAVKEYIEKKFNHENLLLSAKTEGEKHSFPEQLKDTFAPKELKNILKKDRKVEIRLNNVEPTFKIAVPPIKLERKEYWENYFNSQDRKSKIRRFSEWAGLVEDFREKWKMDIAIDKDIEKMEVKNNENLPNSVIEYSARITTVQIITTFSIRKQLDLFIGNIECQVIHSASKRILFAASKYTDPQEEIIELYYRSGGGGGRVIKRKIYDSDVVPEGSKIEKIKLPEWAFMTRSVLLAGPLYKELCGSYASIAERARNVLNKLQIF